MSTHLPKTDSIEQLAQFWQSHDLTDFKDDLEEVEALVFRRRTEDTVPVPLTRSERAAVRKIAASRGVEDAALIHQWVKEKLHHP